MVMDDDRRAKMDARWDALVAQGVDPSEAETMVRREFAPRGVRTPEEIAKANAADRDAAKAHPVQAFIETLVSGQPGGSAAVSGYRGLLGEDPAAAAEDASRNVAQFSEDYPRTALAAKVIGAAPTAVAAGGLKLAQLGARGTGALLGGGMAGVTRLLSNDRPGESVGDRLKGTAIDAILGAGAGAALPWLVTSPTARTVMGAVAGGALAPEGAAPTAAGAATGGLLAMSPSNTARFVADATRRALPKVAGAARAISEATGLRGDVNQELEGIDRIAKSLRGMVGEGGGTGSSINKTADAFKVTANKLFAKAKKDPAILKDKEVLGLINDPDVRSAFEAAARIRAQAGNPIPRVAVGTRDVPSTILQESGEPFMTTEVITEGVPDPATLHLTKRILRDITEGKFTRDQPIPIADALRIQPKVEALAKLLHSRSALFAEADRFFQKGMVAERGRMAGYVAARAGSRNPSPKNIGKTDVAGARRFADKQPDPELQNIAKKSIRRGARDQLREQVAAMPLTRGRAGLLELPGMQPSAAASAQRGLAGGASGLDDMLRTLDIETAGSVPTRFFAPWEVHAAKEMLEPNVNPMLKPGARAIIRAVESDPAKYQQTLAGYMRGRGILDFWNRQMSGQAGATIGR